MILLCFLSAVSCDPFDVSESHPSDDYLISNFQENEADFDKLVTMSNKDSKVIRIAYDFTRLEDNWAWPRPDTELGFSHERWEEYRTLFSKLGLQDGISREKDTIGSVIYLTTSSKGMTFRGSSKGYAYSEHELSPVLDSLEERVKTEPREKHGVLYRKIKDHWYLAYDW